MSIFKGIPGAAHEEWTPYDARFANYHAQNIRGRFHVFHQHQRVRSQGHAEGGLAQAALRPAVIFGTAFDSNSDMSVADSNPSKASPRDQAVELGKEVVNRICNPSDIERQPRI